MRPIILGTLALSLGALTACDFALDDGSGVNAFENAFGPSMSDGALQSRSTNYMRYDGAYVPDAETGYGVAGMAEMTCQLYVNDGYTGTDVDLATGTDNVDDGRPVDSSRPDLGVQVLGHGPDGIHVVSFPSGEVQNAWGTSDVVGAKFDPNGGFYAVVDDGGDCVVDHHSSRDVVTTIDIPDQYCDGPSSLAATPDGLVIVNGSGSTMVDTRGTIEMPMKAHTVTFSDHLNGYFLSDNRSISMVNDEGVPSWNTNLGADVESHAAVGAWQVASLRVDSNNSRLVVIDNETGEVLSDQAVDRPAGTVYGSADGKTVIVATDMASDAYSVR